MNIQASLAWLIEQGYLSEQARIARRLNSYTNQCALVTDQGQSYLLKKLTPHVLAMPVKQHFDKLALASAKGFTPAPIVANIDTGLLLLPWRDCGDIANTELSQSEKIVICARNLQRIHESGLQFPPLNLSDWIASHIQLVSCLERRSVFIAQLARLPVLPDNMPLVPCHMDLSFENQLVNGEIIDWEFALQAPVLVDLSACAVINQLTKNEQILLLNLYFESVNQIWKSADFYTFYQWLELLNQVWFDIYVTQIKS